MDHPPSLCGEPDDEATFHRPCMESSCWCGTVDRTLTRHSRTRSFVRPSIMGRCMFCLVSQGNTVYGTQVPHLSIGGNCAHELLRSFARGFFYYFEEKKTIQVYSWCAGAFCIIIVVTRDTSHAIHVLITRDTNHKTSCTLSIESHSVRSGKVTKLDVARHYMYALDGHAARLSVVWPRRRTKFRSRRAYFAAFTNENGSQPL